MSPITELAGGPFPDPVPSLQERFSEVIQYHPDHIAIVCTQQPAELYGIRSVPLHHEEYRRQPYLRWTFRDLDHGIQTFVNALAQQGLSKGSPLFTFLPNTVEYVMATWAAYRLDCIHVPINPRNLSNVAEVTHMIETVVGSCKAQSIAILASSIEISQQIDKLLPKLGGLNGHDSDCWVKILGHGSAAGWASFESLMYSKTYEQRGITSSGDKTVFFTSGSTSLPKGCMTRCSQFVTSQSFGRGRGAITPGDRMAVVLPNNHMFGYIAMMLALVNAATVIFPGSSFAPQAAIDGMCRERCTHTALVPTMVHALSTLGPKNKRILDSLRHVILSGASITPEALRCCTDRLGASGVEIIYGMTEGVIISTRHVRNLSNIIDHNGRLYIIGRYDDMIIRGGENIEPDVIESVLSQVPALHALNPQIVGSPDHIAGEVPIAIINQAVVGDLAKKIQETIRIKMGARYIPAEVIPLQTLGIDNYPRTMGGKIQKAKLRQLVKTYRQNRGSIPTDRTLERHILEAKLRQHWAHMLGVDASLIDPGVSLAGSADDATLLSMREVMWKDVVRKIPLSDWVAADSIEDQVQLFGNSKEGYLVNPVDNSNTKAEKTIEKFDGTRVVDLLISSIAAENGIKIDAETRLADIGIDSIMALTILDRVNKETGLSLPSSLFFKNHTIGELRERLWDDSAADAADLSDSRVLSKLLHGKIRPDVLCLFLLPPASGYPYSYAQLPEFPNDLAVYALGSPILAGKSAKNWTMQESATAYIKTIRGIQPQGPYLLGGWSFGGILSYEIAVKLRQQGEFVNGLIMLDTPFAKPVPNVPNATIKLLDLTGFFPPITRPGKPDVEMPFHRKQHTVLALQALKDYIPSRVPFGTTTPLRIFMIWARKGNGELLPHKLIEAEHLIKQYGHQTEKRVSNDWQIEPRRSLGPSGWETVVGEENIECHSVDGDHETILLAPQIEDTARLMRMAVEKFLT